MSEVIPGLDSSPLTPSQARSPIVLRCAARTKHCSGDLLMHPHVLLHRERLVASMQSQGWVLQEIPIRFGRHDKSRVVAPCCVGCLTSERKGKLPHFSGNATLAGAPSDPRSTVLPLLILCGGRERKCFPMALAGDVGLIEVVIAWGKRDEAGAVDAGREALCKAANEIGWAMVTAKAQRMLVLKSDLLDLICPSCQKKLIRAMRRGKKSLDSGRY